MWARHPGLGKVHIPPSVTGRSSSRPTPRWAPRSGVPTSTVVKPSHRIHCTDMSPWTTAATRTRKPRRRYFSLPPRHHAEPQRPYPENTVTSTTSASWSPRVRQCEIASPPICPRFHQYSFDCPRTEKELVSAINFIARYAPHGYAHNLSDEENTPGRCSRQRAGVV